MKTGNIWLITTQVFTPECLVSCDNMDVARKQRRNFQKLSDAKKPWELGFNAKSYRPCWKLFFSNLECRYWKVTKGIYVISHWMCSVKVGVLKNFAIFTNKWRCWSLLFMTIQAFRPATLLKRDFRTGVFFWILQNF